jgi:TolB-like protein
VCAGLAGVQNYDVTVPDKFASQAPSADDVHAELARVLSNPHFQASEKRRAFLRYIIEETLAGRADRLKGYSIAVSVFGRDETFDYQADPVVRLEARRLRRDLDSYYVEAGRHDAIRISIPKGSYVPHLEWHEAKLPLTVAGAEHPEEFRTPQEGGASGKLVGVIARIGRNPTQYILIAALVAVAAAVATAGWLLTAENGRSDANADERLPSVVVLPFQALNSTENSRYLASGISQELIGNLMRFPGFRLYTFPAGFEKVASAEPAKLGRDLGVAYVVSGSVNTNAEEIHVVAQSVEAKTGRVLWSQTYDRPLIPEALIRAQSEMAGEIAAVLGQPYGVVRSDLNNRLETPAVSNMQSYVCVLRAYGYRRSFSRQEFAPVLGCLETAVQRDPDYSDAWAMLGWLHVDAGRIPYAGYNTKDEYEKASQAASEAVRLAPRSILALKVLGAVEHYLGHYDQSERITRQALDINPYDPETMAQLGWRLAVRGKFDEGIPILKRAIARTVNPPGWYYHLVAIDLYLKGDYEHMRQVARHADPDNSGFSQVLIAIANGELSNRDAARAALKKLSEYKPLASDPAAFLRRHGAVDDIVEPLMAGLAKARQVAALP